MKNLKIMLVAIATVSMSAVANMAEQPKPMDGEIPFKNEVSQEKKTSIPVKIKYMEDEKIVPNAVVYLLYYDSEKSTLVEKTANTENSQVVSFDVPLDNEGASCPFVFLFTKEDVDKAKELAKTASIRAYRTPKGENCEFLELSVTKGGYTGNNGCAIQMWSISLKQ